MELKKESCSSALSCYLQTIKKISLLTPEEEIVLAQEIAKGNVEARKRFIEANLRLVVKIASYYRKNNTTDFLTLIQEGNRGLIKAVDKFEQKGWHFSTYAVWWIKHYIQRFLSKNEVHLSIKQRELRRRIIGLANTNLSKEELAEKLGFSAEEFEKKVGELDISICSLEDIEEVLEDTNSPTPLELVERKKEVEKIEKILERISSLERNVFKMRFGMDDSYEKVPLEEVGRHFNFSREWINQIVKGVRRKIIEEIY